MLPADQMNQPLSVAPTPVLQPTTTPTHIHPATTDPNPPQPPIPTPSTLETRIFTAVTGTHTAVILDDTNHRQSNLARIGTFEGVMQAAWDMRYGDIVGMQNYFRARGVHPTHSIKKVNMAFAEVPLFFFAILPISLYFYAMRWGLTPRWVAGLTIFTIVMFVSLSRILADYTHNTPGTCLMCGKPVDEQWKRPVHVENHRGRKIKVSNSGYCLEHGGRVDADGKIIEAGLVEKSTWWDTAEKVTWDGFVSKLPRTILRTIGYSILWIPPIRYKEKLIDPRPIGVGHTYLLSDRDTTRDVDSSDMMHHIKEMAFMIMQTADSIERARLQRWWSK